MDEFSNNTIEDTLEATVEAIADRARFIRLETVRLARIAGAGHYSSVFSCAEILATLYYAVMRLRPEQPRWPERDRLVLSKGHVAIGVYPVLADLGYFAPEELDGYARLFSRFGDHPDMKKVPGMDFSAGSLGHGMSAALGIALANRLHGRSGRTFVLVGDGELCEGQIWEAAMAAAHHRVGRLVAIVDINQLSIDGFTRDVMGVEPIEEKFAAFGWRTRRVDGHDIGQLAAALTDDGGVLTDAPLAVLADTLKGKGVARMELSTDWHVGNLVGVDYDDVVAELSGATP